MNNPRNIAVVGAGISGLSAAWLLSQKHKVTLYEAAPSLGGHANTVDVQTPDGPVAVDTGFIVYNEKNYPNLVALFEHLNVPTSETEMSFAFTCDDGAYEYSGSGAAGFFGQPRNLFSPPHWQLLRDVQRFFATASARLDACGDDPSLGQFLDREAYCQRFIEQHIVPMGAAIWSTSEQSMLAFPARAFIDFYANHGMLQFKGRPLWRSVAGGSARYVERLVDDGRFERQSGCRIRSIARHPTYVRIEDERGVARPFDDVVLATHADESLRLLEAPDAMEQNLLGAFSYQPNRAVLHSDKRWMPRRRHLWSSWNYVRKQPSDIDGNLCVTYWMNSLQKLDTQKNLFVTLNPTDDIHPKAVAGVFDYSHPVFDRNAMAAREMLWSLQGRRRTWFCGSYFGFGFHEDGLQSGLAVAEQLGQVRRPWQTEGLTSRIFVTPANQEAAE